MEADPGGAQEPVPAEINKVNEKPRVRDRNRMAETHAEEWSIGSVRSMIARPEGGRHKKSRPRKGTA